MRPDLTKAVRDGSSSPAGHRTEIRGKRTRYFAVTALVLATATGCGATDETAVSQPDRGTIGIAMPTTESVRWVGDGESIVRQFQLLGYKTDLRYAEDDIDKQVDQISDMIENGDKALVIGAIDGTALKSVLARAADAEIPVISYDRLIRDTPNITYYATFDNFKVGVLQAGAIVKALKLTGTKDSYNIELFAGSADDNNATFFFNGAMSVLQPYLRSGRLRVASGETAFAKVATQRWDGAVAKKRMQRLLAGPLQGERVDAVLAPNDGLSRSILEAFEEDGYGRAGRKLPVITGQDAELESAKLIAAGKQTQTVYKDTRELAKVAVQMTNSLLLGGVPEVNDEKQYDNGVKVVPTFLLQPVNVDRSNYQRVLVQGGYYTAGQLAG
ncbi:multiple monosaccharide ABC transporter substrate-binding protein [Actinoplanes teichomyceticus]|uniref:Putative multiple sugar transport system substrate-binding protein n=1 Tax=Actinoplanes teichomyceticus TaxID=1867 RepID=A0A561VL97_ACTTI|nr:multiple monosaccharide ABC transporter substrate-binding protein [Actinoplanes teichomyceticus]TWG12370.1 putative multiple sugar transport system substrate-binding protein [Actinoplanes teichomyceticus]GIF13729.1 sugar ABC transporter substrate-binding protein [Actinoplanes teichomyceticus]